MALGPIMKFTTDKGLPIELAPFAREDLPVFVEGFAHGTVTQYLSAHRAQTIETEQAWYDEIIKDKTRLAWGIWVVNSGQRQLIGNTALVDITKKHIHYATSAVVIADKAFWGQGIVSACHRARTWYAFENLGLHRIKSAVIRGNIASLRALEKCGYEYVYTERNEVFTNGKLRHMDCLECLNPADWAWRQWWGDDRPPRKSLEARKRAQAAVDWARQNVTLE
jgi:hypothetical protein